MSPKQELAFQKTNHVKPKAMIFGSKFAVLETADQDSAELLMLAERDGPTAVEAWSCRSDVF